MIGLDFPLHPEWIAAVHRLWQPQQPLDELVRAALAQTMPELGGEKARRNTLTIILRLYVAAEGGGHSRRTAAREAWVACSRRHPAELLRPAYLAQLVAQTPLAQEAASFVARRAASQAAPGAVLRSSDLRHHLIGRYGERSVVLNSASAFLRTLQNFGVLAAGERPGEYRWLGRLPVAPQIFPLLVWVAWQAAPAPQIDLHAFEQELPGHAFLETEDFEAGWQAHQSRLWGLSERFGERVATLKVGSAEEWKTALLKQMEENHATDST